jgi:endonuclease/exonuclease/phosphatase family metal-dependent hydrolase
VLNLEELTPDEWDRLRALRAPFPGRVVDPQWGSTGTAVLVDCPVEPTDRTAHFTVAGAPPVSVSVVHPRPPVNPGAARVWRGLMRALPGSDGQGDVQILAGDFNATLDHAELRRVLDRGYIDAADAVGKGFVWTWPALPRRALPITIDHVLVDRRVHVRSVTVVRIPGTDHRAVIAQLELPAG